MRKIKFCVFCHIRKIKTIQLRQVQLKFFFSLPHYWIPLNLWWIQNISYYTMSLSPIITKIPVHSFKQGTTNGKTTQPELTTNIWTKALYIKVGLETLLVSQKMQIRSDIANRPLSSWLLHFNQRELGRILCRNISLTRWHLFMLVKIQEI